MKKITTTIATALLTFPAVAFAQIDPPQGIRSFGGVINVLDTFIGWIFTILLSLAVIFIIYAAFLYVTAGGNDEKISKAHSIIIYAVVALAVAFLAQGVSFIIGELLNSGGAGVQLQQ